MSSRATRHRWRSAQHALGALAALSAVLVTSLAPAADRAAPYNAAARTAHIAAALTALGQASRTELQEGADFARGLARGACAAGAERLRVECLTVAMRRYCHDRTGADAQRCPFTMDVLVSTMLAEERLIPVDRRYEIIRENTDYRAALAREMHRLQGSLAVDFRLRSGPQVDTEDPPALAADIDRFCLASADETKLTYPTCVSSLVWFIRGSAK
jgi:hypothetical protein